MDIHQDFRLTYALNDAQQTTLRQLKPAIEGVQRVYVATQNNPDGESQAFLALKLAQVDADVPILRLRPNAFTPEQIQAALKQPSRLHFGWIESQQTRRTLDRLLAFLVAPAIGKFLDRSVYLTRGVMLALGVLRLRQAKLQTWDELRWSMQEAQCTHQRTLEETILILKSKDYVAVEGGNLTLSDTSTQILDLLTQHSPLLCSPSYHARLELGLQQVEHGKLSRLDYLNSFWKHFKPHLVTLNRAAQRHVEKSFRPLQLHSVAEGTDNG